MTERRKRSAPKPPPRKSKQPAAPDPKPDRAILAPGHTYATVTDQISSIVLTRRQPLAWLITLLIGFLFAFVYPTSTFLRQHQDISAAEQRLARLEHETAKLEQANERLQNPAEIERIAREQYGMTRPNETPYVLVPTPPPTTTPSGFVATQPLGGRSTTT